MNLIKKILSLMAYPDHVELDDVAVINTPGPHLVDDTGAPHLKNEYIAPAEVRRLLRDRVFPDGTKFYKGTFLYRYGAEPDDSLTFRM